MCLFFIQQHFAGDYGLALPGADPDGKMPPSTAGGTPAATLIPRANLETFIHSGDQASHFEAARVEGTDYKRRLPRTIEDHARLLDDKLADIAVCDPAIGSGAFPVGMMQEIVRARSALTPYFNDVHERTAYHFKRHAIQNCLYGVDIDPGAVEIAKLRLWLSLVVDEDDVKQIKPLPNLDYKIVTGNSLLGVEKNLFNVDLFKRLEELKPRYFDATDRQQKEKFKHEIDDLIHELTNGKEAFDFEIYFAEVMDKKRRGGFDAVIGNPPYVRQEAIKDFKPALKAEGYECFDGVADLLVYFYERGVKLLRGGGTIALITSNKFYRAGYGEKLRGFLTRELTLHRLIVFGDAPVFEAIAYASILAGVRAAPARDASALAYTWEKEMAFDRIAQIVPERGQQIRQSELKPDGWQLESPAVFRLLKKLRRAGKPLGELPRTAFFNGIKTGLNPAFVLSRTERDAIVSAEPEAATLFKPFLRGRDVKRWRVQSADLWLLYLPWHFPLHSDGTIRTSSAEAEKAFKAQFPIVHKHLKRFSESLRKRDASEVGVRYEWYVLSRPRFESAPQFAKPKVVIPTIVNDVEYAVDREGYFSNDKTTLLACENPEFITALLNSKPLFWFMRQTAAQKQGGFYEFKPMYVSALPIPAVPSEQQKPVERLVERILSAKQRDAGADVSAWERELDEWVYALYGLTPEEIKLVEGQTK